MADMLPHVVDEPLQAFVRVSHVDDQHLIICKFYRDTTTGRIVRKYGLTCSGSWLFIEEGHAAPQECLIPIGY